MKFRHLLLLGSLAFSPLALAQSVITWTEVTNISVNDTDVINTGELVYAYNLGSNPFTVIINGYTFQAAPNAGNSDYAFTHDGTTSDAYDEFFAGYWEGMSGPYAYLLRTARYVDGGDAVLTLNNLAVGQAYQIQLWMNDARNAGSVFGRNAIVSDEFAYTSATVAFNQGLGGGSQGGALGQFVVGQFVASASTQQIFIDRGPGGDGNSVQLNAFALSAVPEPSTYAALLGLGALGFAVWRRRRVTPTRAIAPRS